MAKRDIGVFIRDIIRKPPAAFPWIALFHVLMVLFVLIFWWGTPISFYYIELAWTLGFTVSWLYVCDLRKWAAYSYLALTIANMILYVVSLSLDDLSKDAFQGQYISALLIPAFIFSFIVLFVFKRFDKE